MMKPSNLFILCGKEAVWLQHVHDKDEKFGYGL